MKRRKTPTVMVDQVKIGSDHPVVVQSMTNTPTADVEATVTQICELADAGSELVRITVNDERAAQAVPAIMQHLRDQGCHVPVVGDFHYNGHTLLTRHPKMAESLAKYRINPGNVGHSNTAHDQFREIIQVAKNYHKPVRIGVNFGSLDQTMFTGLMAANAALPKPESTEEVIIKAMINSALSSAERAEALGLSRQQLILSVKMSTLPQMVTVNTRLAEMCDYVLHLGLTEAGAGLHGVAASSAALGILLQQGIGDTIRISLTPEPGVPRSMEVAACQTLLQALGLRHFRPGVTSCPGCGRTASQDFITLAADINAFIDLHLAEWKRDYPGVETLKIAVMGCVVNGPGESRHADIGISLPGTTEQPIAPVYQDGELFTRLKGDQITSEFKTVLTNYIQKRFGKSNP